MFSHCFLLNHAKLPRCHLIAVLVIFIYIVVVIIFYPNAILKKNFTHLEILNMQGILTWKNFKYVISGHENRHATLCNGTGIKRERTSFRVGFNVFDVAKLDFLPNYKNPVFKYMEKDSIRNGTFSNIRCLPYFFIIGMPKCGTTDVWKAMGLHADITSNHFKEPMWFTRRRFGEASVDTMFDNPHWELYPKNNQCNEPIILNQHFLHFLNPKIKIIVLLRDPIERVFSDYIFQSQIYRYDASSIGFHNAVKTALNKHNDCLKYMTQRGCAYKKSLETYKARLRVGMYHIFIEDWWQVFPKEQVFILRFEEYTNDTLHHLQNIFKFLELRPLTEIESEKVLSKPVQNKRRNSFMNITMLPETRYLLQKLYTPFNKKLAALLKDPNYLWD